MLGEEHRRLIKEYCKVNQKKWSANTKKERDGLKVVADKLLDQIDWEWRKRELGYEQ